MTEAVVWLVLWALLVFLGSGIIYAAFAGIGILIAAGTGGAAAAVIGVVIGYVGAVAWFIFAAVQTVLQIISVVQLASAG